MSHTALLVVVQVPDEARAKAAVDSKLNQRSEQFPRPIEGQFQCTHISIQILFATGDVMAQQAVEKVGSKRHNFARTGRMALYGGGTQPSCPLLYELKRLTR